MPSGDAQKWKILIPTRDSARWIGSFAEEYKRKGWNPLFVYDARSKDNTLAILRAKGFEPLIYTGSGADIVEGGILEFGARNCGAEWLLRLDDDEFPSEQLIYFVSILDSTTPVDAYFVSTRELFRHDDSLYYSRHRYRYWCHIYGSYLNPHLRIFRPDKANFKYELHSAGLEIVGSTAFAPEQYYYIHLNSVLRSFSERVSKIKRYDLIRPGMGWFYGEEYLPELITLTSHRGCSDGFTQFEALIRSLPSPERADSVKLQKDDSTKFSEALRVKWRLYYEERGGKFQNRIYTREH